MLKIKHQQLKKINKIQEKFVYSLKFNLYMHYHVKIVLVNSFGSKYKR